MQEIEVKIIEINKEEIVKKLLELGAEKVFEGIIQARSYDFEDNRLTKDNSFIRLRKKGDKPFLTFKKKVSQEEAKIFKEFETEVSSFETMHKILEALNMRPQKDYKKKRTSYKFKDVLFEIDEYEEIPAFMEIEAPNIETINSYIEKLGINKDNVKTWTGKQMFIHYGIESGFMRV